MASIIRAQARQSFCFVLINTNTGAGATGASISGFVRKDLGPQIAIAGKVVEQGLGQYSYQPTLSETDAASVSFIFVATGANLINLQFFTDAPGVTNTTSVLNLPINCVLMGNQPEQIDRDALAKMFKRIFRE